jgi:hypothetical protein
MQQLLWQYPMWPTLYINDLSSVCQAGKNWFRYTLTTSSARSIFGSPRKSITKFICELHLPQLSVRQILNATEPCRHQVRNVQGLRLVPSVWKWRNLNQKFVPWTRSATRQYSSPETTWTNTTAFFGCTKNLYEPLGHTREAVPKLKWSVL